MSDVAAVSIKGVCLDAVGRALLCRNDRAEWELPGGHPHLGEPFASCLDLSEIEAGQLLSGYRQVILKWKGTGQRQ